MTYSCTTANQDKEASPLGGRTPNDPKYCINREAYIYNVHKPPKRHAVIKAIGRMMCRHRAGVRITYIVARMGLRNPLKKSTIIVTKTRLFDVVKLGELFF